MYSKSEQLKWNKPKNNKPFKDEYTIVIEKCDYIFAKYIKKRDKVCKYTGIRNGLHCCHIVSRRNWALRWNENNAITLHWEKHLVDWHVTKSKEMEEWFKNKYPDRWEILSNQKYKYCRKPTIQEIQDIITHYEILLSEEE